MTGKDQIFNIRPSALSYFCPRCAYDSQINDLEYSGISAGITQTLDGIEKNYFLGDCKKIDVSLDEGKVIDPYNITFYSKVLLDNKDRRFRIKGKGDAIIKFKDGTCGIIDYKTSKFKKRNKKDYQFKEEHLEKKISEYDPQLHAYYLLYSNLEDDHVFLKSLSSAKSENAIESSLQKKLEQIREISVGKPKIFGLVFVYPETEEENLRIKTNSINVNFSYKYCPVQINLGNFMKKITSYLDLMFETSPPIRNKKCEMCKFLDKYDNKNI